MPTKRRGSKRKAPEGKGLSFDYDKAHVRITWRMIDSAAFKTLSPAAVWLLIQLHRQFRASAGGYSHLILPYSDVKWRFSFKAFKAARQELIDGGFIRIIHQSGGMFKVPNIYALAEGWEARSKELHKDVEAGRWIKKQRSPEDLAAWKGPQEWAPFKTTARAVSARENWKKAVEAKSENLKRKTRTTRRRQIKEHEKEVSL